MLKQTNYRFLWSLPQPLFVFGCTWLVASASVNHWADPWLLVGLFLWLSFPLFLLLERLIPRRKDWLLTWRNIGTDAFWVFATYLFWVPLYSRYYDSNIEAMFEKVRASIGFDYQLEADSIGGLIGMAMIALFAAEFIGYWAHRLQHRFLFLWRMHATHHHITKMSVARADRTHPLEFIGLNLGFAIVFAFLGVSAEVVAVAVVFRTTTAHINHCNLPLTSGVFGWLFNTAEWHQLHHSNNYAESNTNYGCAVILWDRVFGTFSDKTSIERVGNGSGRKLSLLTQLCLPFYSNSAIRKL